MGKGNERGGRPSVITEFVLQKLREAYALDCTDEEAAAYAGVCARAIYKYQERNPDFIDEKKALKQKPFLIARNCLINGIKSDPDLALKYLERKKKDEFSLRSEFTGADGDKLECSIIDYRGKNNNPTAEETD